MATYTFRCGADGEFDVSLPMGTAGGAAPCPACGDAAARRYAAPALGLADRRIGAAIDRAERSRTEPDVVTSIPTSGRPRRADVAPPNPALRKLPRP